jgi:hypothetical protein
MTSQFLFPCFTHFHSLFPISLFTFSFCSSSVNVHLVLSCVYALYLGSKLSSILKNSDLCEHPVINTELSDTMVLLLDCLSLRLFFIVRFLLCGLRSRLFTPFSSLQSRKCNQGTQNVPLFLTLYSSLLSVSCTSCNWICIVSASVPKTCIYYACHFKCLVNLHLCANTGRNTNTKYASDSSVIFQVLILFKNC